MKKMRLFSYSYFLITLLRLAIYGCTDEAVAPLLEELRNQEFDLVVISSADQSVPVTFKAQAKDLKEVRVEVVAQGSTEVVAGNTLKNITSNSLNRVSMNVLFPSNDVAPSGIYTVNYNMTGASTVSGGSYDINVINNVNPVYCEYTSGLPSGANVWIRLYVPEGASLPEGDETIYITGSFGVREGGSDWDGGGDPNFAFTKLDDTCYEIALHLESGDEFKITRGNWDKQLATATGKEGSNIPYKGESVIPITVYNWKDLLTITPEVPESLVLNVPAAAVKAGMLTFVANAGDGVDVTGSTYYVVKKGAASLDRAYEMVAFDGENKLAVAVPKADMEYVVVKDAIDAVDTNRYGFEQSAGWDGQTNPVQVAIGTFEGAAFTLGEKIVIVGAATPGDWGVSSGQDFTKADDGLYEITIALNTDSEYLLLPDYGQWDDKWAYGNGDALSGTFDGQGNGSNLFTAGIETGTYMISVDFTSGNGGYTLSKQ